MRPFMFLSFALSLSLAACASPAPAQHEHQAPADSTMAGMPGMQHDAEQSMSGAMATNPHIRMTARRRATAADSARARALVDTLRRALVKYRDVSVAEDDGYRMFAPQVKNQRVYHFTRNMAAVKAAFTFDASSPTSLLYTKDAAGKFTLVGAMYTAPRRASEDDLNARVPLSIAQWHEHVDICVPKRGDTARWKETANGQLRFGPAGAIATKAECDAANGRWFDHLFGWMVHANVFASDELGEIWGDHHDSHAMMH
ncbi:MAG TPA: hypothetical protein VHM30_17880 [Gemmatimonadaceae bacterium]|nr:hypothetical protein [Gemmatimonadaceae bacterium]